MRTAASILLPALLAAGCATPGPDAPAVGASGPVAAFQDACASNLGDPAGVTRYAGTRGLTAVEGAEREGLRDGLRPPSRHLAWRLADGGYLNLETFPGFAPGREVVFCEVLLPRADKAAIEAALTRVQVQGRPLGPPDDVSVVRPGFPSSGMRGTAWRGGWGGSVISSAPAGPEDKRMHRLEISGPSR